jgi:Ser/Thr protein kinase RdoA (MazF antagonist)
MPPRNGDPRSTRRLAALRTPPPTVLDAFGLRGAEVRPLNKGFGSRKWLVQRRGEVFVVRGLSGADGLDRPAFVAAVQQHIACATGLSPMLLSASDGRDFHFEGDTGFIAVGYVPGRAGGVEPSRRACRSLGHVLGRVHAALRSLPVEGGGAELMTIPTQPEAGLNEAIRLAVAARRPAVAAALRYKLRRLESVDEADRYLFRSVVERVIHGDFHPDNVVSRVGRPAGVIDYDRACRFPHVYELIRGLMLSVRPSGAWSNEVPRLRAFLEGYASWCSPTPEETDIAVPLYRYVQLADTHGLTVTADGRVPNRSFGLARVARICWLDLHERQLRELVRSTLSRA